MKKIEQSPACVLQAGVNFMAPWIIKEYKASQTCALAAGSRVFLVSTKVSCHNTVLGFFLACGLRVFVFETLQDACLSAEYRERHCDLLFFDADSCADILTAQNTIGKMQAAISRLSVIIVGASGAALWLQTEGLLLPTAPSRTRNMVAALD